MKKYLLIIIISFLGCASLGYLFFRSQSDFSKDHQEILEQFSNIQQSDTTVNKEILSLQYFLSQSDDSLDQPLKNLKDFCNLSVMQYFFNSRSLEYDVVFDSFCQKVDLKLRKIEEFKQRSAEYRKAVLFLQHQSNHFLDKKSDSIPLSKGDEEVIKGALIYALMPRDDAKLNLQKVIKQVAHQKQSSVVHNEIFKNTQEILNTRSTLDQLTQEIVKTDTRDLIIDLRDRYFKDYQKSQTMANYFSNLLFVASLILFIFVVYKSILLMQATTALQESNQTLEQRVLIRTRELTESQMKIIEQQQALIGSAKMSALGEMAAGIAHEINTPLAIIQMRTTQLIEGLDEEPLNVDFFRSSLDKIDQTAVRISKIIKSLVSFSRDGKRDARETSSVKKMIQETLELCRERFKANNVDLEIKADQDVQFYCHPTDIVQVLVNFLNNAVDAIHGQKTKWVHLALHVNPDDFAISITDSGHGIPLDIQEKIMQPFFTTKEVGKGTGLGLSISKGIVKNHEGVIEIDNSCANTRFIITFPRNAV